MTKSWWVDQPGKHYAKTSSVDEEAVHRLPVTWWTVALVIIVLVTVVVAGIYLLAGTVDSCQASGRCQ